MALTRLTASSLASAVADGPLPDAVSLPRERPTRTGIVHLGTGAFHRAHQAVYTEDAAFAAGENTWGILEVTGRSAAVAEQLRPQDGLYSVLTTGPDADELRVVGIVSGVASPTRDAELVLATLAAETTHLVTITITEKGYRIGPDGGPDPDDAGVVSDLAALVLEVTAPEVAAAPGGCPIGLLVRGLWRRFAAGGAPITVLCCDNMVANGAVVRTLVEGWVGLLAEHVDAAAFGSWLRGSVTFPSTMVDRIVPATTQDHHDRAEGLLPLRDEALVAAEAFGQWVIEDRFAGPRPSWELVGATLASDVAPFERAKLRLLNGAHSAVAYLGHLRGHTTIAEAIDDVAIRELVLALFADDVLPTLEAPDGFDLAEFCSSILDRFADPSTGYTVAKVAMDGSQKLPIRLLGTARDRIAAGGRPRAIAAAAAAWAVYVERLQASGAPSTDLNDPNHAELFAIAEQGDAAVALLGYQPVFGEDLPRDAAFREDFVAAVTELRTQDRQA